MRRFGCVRMAPPPPIIEPPRDPIEKLPMRCACDVLVAAANAATAIAAEIDRLTIKRLSGARMLKPPQRLYSQTRQTVYISFQTRRLVRLGREANHRVRRHVLH